MKHGIKHDLKRTFYFSTFKIDLRRTRGELGDGDGMFEELTADPERADSMRGVQIDGRGFS